MPSAVQQSVTVKNDEFGHKRPWRDSHPRIAILQTAVLDYFTTWPNQLNPTKVDDKKQGAGNAIAFLAPARHFVTIELTATTSMIVGGGSMT